MEQSVSNEHLPNSLLSTKTKCPHCNRGRLWETAVAKSIERKYNGITYTAHFSDLVVSKCDKCQDIFLNQFSDEQIDAAFQKMIFHNN